MKLLVVTLLLAISYAQTECSCGATWYDTPSWTHYSDYTRLSLECEGNMCSDIGALNEFYLKSLDSGMVWLADQWDMNSMWFYPRLKDGFYTATDLNWCICEQNEGSSPSTVPSTSPSSSPSDSPTSSPTTPPSSHPSTSPSSSPSTSPSSLPNLQVPIQCEDFPTEIGDHIRWKCTGAGHYFGSGFSYAECIHKCETYAVTAGSGCCESRATTWGRCAYFTHGIAQIGGGVPDQSATNCNIPEAPTQPAQPGYNFDCPCAVNLDYQLCDCDRDGRPKSRCGTADHLQSCNCNCGTCNELCGVDGPKEAPTQPAQPEISTQMQHMEENLRELN